jgi:hypothetical protein
MLLLYGDDWRQQSASHSKSPQTRVETNEWYYIVRRIRQMRVANSSPLVFIGHRRMNELAYFATAAAAATTTTINPVEDSARTSTGMRTISAVNRPMQVARLPYFHSNFQYPGIRFSGHLCVTTRLIAERSTRTVEGE